MGTIRKRIGKNHSSWIAEVCVNNIRKSKSFRSRKECQNWILSQEQNGVFPKHTLHEAFERYKDYALQLRGKQPAISRLKSIQSRLKDIPLEDFTFADFNKWKELRKKEVGPNSLNREAGVINQVFRMCITHWGWLHKHPIPDIGRLKDKPPRKRGISEIEIKTILNNLKLNIHGVEISILFELAIETGMRLGELISIEWENVYEKYIHLKMTKNGYSRDVPLSKRARELVNQRIGINDVFVFSINAQNASKNFLRCSINGVRFHDTRSEAITRLSSKLSILDLASAVGHRDLRSLQIYYKDNVQSMADRLG